MKINLNSLVFKVAILYIAITFLNVSIFNIIVWENQTELIMENAILDSRYKGTSVKYFLSDIVKDTCNLKKDVLEEITQEMSHLTIDEFSLIDEYGKIIYTSSQNTGRKESVSVDDIRLINRALTENSFQGSQFTHRLNEKDKTIDLFIPFTYATSNVAVFTTTLQMKDIESNMNQLYRECLVITSIIILIHLVFALILSRVLLVPLRRLLVATQEISRGNFTTRIPISGTDELGMLASSFNEMSTAISSMQDEAKGANPLTELPGNITIASKIDELIHNKMKFAVLYCDLDNFKAYNDKYGFIKGDDAILYSRNKLIEASHADGVHDVFVGHEGGDDFVIIAPIDCWEAFVVRFIELFDQNIGVFYNPTDRKNGYISSVNRQGDLQRFPLMSMSIAVVTNSNREFLHHGEVVQIAAEVKKYVKQQDGSCYKIDERSKTM